jgi:hypothetical protein
VPDDSREEDEREAARRLRELRARVKAARSVVSTTPGLADTLQRDWQKAARFYARFGVTEAMFRFGASPSSHAALDAASELLSLRVGSTTGRRQPECGEGTLPEV